MAEGIQAIALQRGFYDIVHAVNKFQNPPEQLLENITVRNKVAVFEFLHGPCRGGVATLFRP